MPKLVDVDALRHRLLCQPPRNISINFALELVSTMPTVDAEPVRHGKWTHNQWSNMRHDYSCSLCGCRISGVDPFNLSATAYYYCPECGAMMDEIKEQLDERREGG